MELNLEKLLPSFEELKLLDIDDIEATYIFKLASEALGHRNPVSQSDYEEAFYLTESLVDRTWERINSGHFSLVPAATRKVYAAACFLKIVFLLLDSVDEAQLTKCYQLLDNAILVGCASSLYSTSREFVQEVTAFLNKRLKKIPTKQLARIEPLPYDPDCRCDIDRLDCPSVDFFTENFFKCQKPLLLKNTIAHWPARSKWCDPNYLLEIAGNRFVPVEIGTNYANEDWSQEMTKFKDFLVRQFDDDDSSKSVEIEYLAQHELFDQIPELKEDIRIPDYCLMSKTDANDVDIKGWLGPKGTTSPLHQDPKHNILCQVFGVKRVILASSADSEFLYPHEGEMLRNTSKVDAENVDLAEYPLARRVKFYHLMLQEGDAVYIPPKWWHHIKSLNKSFSVSFWWD